MNMVLGEEGKERDFFERGGRVQRWRIFTGVFSVEFFFVYHPL